MANYISEINVALPNGAVDLVSSLDDYIREDRKVLIQSFPNVNKQVRLGSDQMNQLKDFWVRDGAAWHAKDGGIFGVKALDNNSAVEPRSYNDDRYLKRDSNLADIKDKNAAYANLMSGVTTASPGFTQTLKLMADYIEPAGSVYMNASRKDNPAGYKKYGVWAPYCPGRVLAGAGSAKDFRGETRTLAHGATGGAFQTQLTVAQMPAHQHRHVSDDQMPDAWGGKRFDQYWYDADSNTKRHRGTDQLTAPEGGNQPHEISQPWQAVQMWIRTA